MQSELVCSLEKDLESGTCQEHALTPLWHTTLTYVEGEGRDIVTWGDIFGFTPVESCQTQYRQKDFVEMTFKNSYSYNSFILDLQLILRHLNPFIIFNIRIPGSDSQYIFWGYFSYTLKTGCQFTRFECVTP